MAGTFSVGDVVRLNSGGSKMTVTSVDQEQSGPFIVCTWFNNDKAEFGRFLARALKRFEAKARSAMRTRRPDSGWQV